MKKALIIFLFFGLNFASFGQKNVLLEKFTNLYCGSCPDRSILLTDLEATYPNLIWISHYSYSVFEYNPLVYPGGKEMWEDLHVFGTPQAIVDRTPHNNSLASSSGNWASQIQEQQTLEDYIDIEFGNVNFDQQSRNLTFEVSCQFHTLPVNTENFRVLLYVTEDHVKWRQHSYYNNTAGHPLEGLGDVIQEYYHQNVLRMLLSGGWGAENIIPDNPIIGESYTQTFSYKIPAMYNPSNIELTAAISQHDEADYMNRPILNAERVQLQDFVVTNTNESELTTFNAFPNPSGGVINLQFKEMPTQLTLENMNGTLIKQYTINGLTMQIDLGNMPAGHYILNITNGDKSMSQKIIKH